MADVTADEDKYETRNFMNELAKRNTAPDCMCGNYAGIEFNCVFDLS